MATSHYQISFQTGYVIDTEKHKYYSCTAGHTFEPSSNPPSSYDSVSVAAENVVGVGAARTYSAQLISSYLFTMMHYILINSFVTKFSCHNLRGGGEPVHLSHM